MNVKFENVFSGDGAWGGEVEQQGLGVEDEGRV